MSVASDGSFRGNRQFSWAWMQFPFDFLHGNLPSLTLSPLFMHFSEQYCYFLAEHKFQKDRKGICYAPSVHNKHTKANGRANEERDAGRFEQVQHPTLWEVLLLIYVINSKPVRVIHKQYPKKKPSWVVTSRKQLLLTESASTFKSLIWLMYKHTKNVG